MRKKSEKHQIFRKLAADSSADASADEVGRINISASGKFFREAVKTKKCIKVMKILRLKNWEFFYIRTGVGKSVLTYHTVDLF